MGKLRRFFGNVYRSATDIAFYQEVLKAKFGFSLKYLFFLLFLITLIDVVFIAVSLYPKLTQVPALVAETKKQAPAWYPDDVVVTISKGVVSTNVEEPFILEFPPKLLDIFDNEHIKPEPMPNLLVIDTKGTVDDFPTYQTIVLMTKNAVVYPDNENEGYRVRFLEPTMNFIIDRALYEKGLAYVFPYLDYVPILSKILFVAFIVLGPVAGAYFALVGKLIYLLIMTLIILVFAKLLNREMKYGSLYRIGIHALTAPIFIDVILGNYSIHIPFLYTGLYVVYMTYILTKLKSAQPDAPKVTSNVV